MLVIAIALCIMKSNSILLSKLRVGDERESFQDGKLGEMPTFDLNLDTDPSLRFVEVAEYFKEALAPMA